MCVTLSSHATAVPFSRPSGGEGMWEERGGFALRVACLDSDGGGTGEPGIGFLQAETCVLAAC